MKKVIFVGALLLVGIVLAAVLFTRQSGFSIVDGDCRDSVRYGVALTVYGGPEGNIALVDRKGQVSEITNDGRSFAPSFSPDGTKLAFTRASGYSDTMGFEKQWIVTSNVDGTGVSKLTNGQHFDLEAAWSPNGDVIAFTRGDFIPNDSDFSGGLVTVPATGGAPEVIFEHENLLPRSAQWSSDGNRIAFLLEESLYVIDADGSNPTKIADGIGDQGIEWSPDGETFAFQSDGIYTLTFEDPTPRQWRSGSEYLAPEFSPDGSHLLYIVRSTGRLRGDFEGTRALVEPLDGGEAKRLAKEGLSPEWVAGLGGYGAKDWLDCP